jgi:hypothetical protein
MCIKKITAARTSANGAQKPDAMAYDQITTNANNPSEPARVVQPRTLSPLMRSCQSMRYWQTMNLLGFITYSSCL